MRWFIHPRHRRTTPKPPAAPPASDYNSHGVPLKQASLNMAAHKPGGHS